MPHDLIAGGAPFSLASGKRQGKDLI